MNSDISEREVKEFVKKFYGRLAASCCSPNLSCCSNLTQLYPLEDLQKLPASIKSVASGCGNPVSLADLHEGQTVLDLGCGGGIDVFLAAKRVGPKGKVIGVDMSPEMIRLARQNATRTGLQNVEFKLGEIENLPIEDESIDVIISNCVINMSLDKDKVFKEAFRVLKPSGCMVISDVVRHGEIPKELKENVESWAACAAGALTERGYIQKIRKAGFKKVQVLLKTTYRADLLEIESPQAQDLIKRFSSCIPKRKLKGKGRIIAIGPAMKGTAKKFDGKFSSIAVKATK
jgi:ubiquinone/menaquinone biosynthesis C-methylase UbiE